MTMPELMTLTDATLDSVLNGEKPALILVTNGEGVRGDFNSAFKKAAGENGTLVFATIDPTRNPAAAARFEAGSKPVLIGWCGGEVLRRPRPWGSDLTLAVEQMRATAPAPVSAAPQAAKDMTPVDATPKAVIDKPVKVTDATFESEVLNSDLPVLVDFWAEWCGPCRTVAPTLDKLAKEFAGQVKIAKVNVDENPGVSQAFKVMSIPNIMLIKQRTIVFNQPGALPEPAFRDLLKQLIALEIPPQEAAPTPAQ
jgi:thioredoxin 1